MFSLLVFLLSSGVVATLVMINVVVMAIVMVAVVVVVVLMFAVVRIVVIVDDQSCCHGCRWLLSLSLSVCLLLSLLLSL